VKAFFDNKANGIALAVAQSAAAAFAIWQIGTGGPYQGLALALLIPTSLLVMVLSFNQLRRYF
jgi:hypothetical protein